MIHYKKSVSWVVIFAFFISLLTSTGTLYPKPAFAYDAPPKDQGHTGPNPPPPPPKEPPPEQCPLTGSPAHLRTGNYFYSHQDLLVPSGCNISLEITRQYHSQNAYEGPFGYGWSFDLLMELITEKEGDKEYVTIRKGDGVRLKFEKNEDSTFTPPAGRHDTLVQNGDGTYDLSSGASGCSSCGEQTHFDSSGRLIYQRDGNGNQMDFTYDGSGKISEITDPYGRKIIFAFGTNNKISQVTDPASRTFSYTYDSQGNLISYTDPIGNTTTYAYDTNHNLVAVVDPRGNTIHSMTYDSADRCTSYTEGAEAWTIAYYPDQSRTTERDSSGNTWQYYYNTTGQITREIDPLGKNVYYTWDANQNWISKQDARGYTTTYTYDSNGNRLTETDPIGNTTGYTYDAVTSKIAAVTDPLGRVTKYEYDAYGNRTKVIKDFGGSLQNQTLFAYDSDGNVTGMIDPLGNSTTYTYDSFGNLVQATDALGNITAFTYDVLGNKLTETDERGNTTTYTYDSLNKLTSVKDTLGNTSTYSYDTAGNLIAVIDAAGNTTNYGYDSYNRLIQVTDALSNVTQHTYDSHGNRTRLTDANGNTTIYAYDTLDRLTSETNALGHVTSYTYDANGNRLTVRDANGNTTAHTYDALNRLTRITYPDGGIESFSYNVTGNLTEKTDRVGNTIDYTYDSLYRIIGKGYPDGTAEIFTYDLNSNIISVSNTDAAYAFAYDALNRVTQAKNTTLGKNVSYSYICCGLKSSMTNPEGGATTYVYDGLNRLTSLTNPYGESTSYVYNILSNVLIKNLANGSHTNYSYDATGKILSLVNATSSGASISTYTYSYDNTGNRKLKTTIAGTHNYTYDNTYQLLQAVHPSPPSESYTYDPVHSRLTSTDHNNWTYDSNNRLISYGNYAYSYDANGNMTGKTDIITSETSQYTYDYNNRLTRIDYPDGTYSAYGYDSFGNRIKKDLNGTVLWFVYDLVKMLPDMIAEYDVSGALVASYTHGPGIDDVVSMRRSGNSYFYFKDDLDSITSIIDNSESLVNNYEYGVFGNVITKIESVVNQYGYTGRIMDSESGLMYYRTRYYSPIIGRFITADPIGFMGGINSYSYVVNNPTNLTDPLGLNPLSPKCQRILKKIRNIQKKIEGRLKDLEIDKLNLPERCPGDIEKPSLSKYGHREILIKKDKANLARWKAKYLTECSDEPPNGTPAPDTSYFDSKYWEKLTGLSGTALLLYILWNSKGCLAGPMGCLLDWATPVI